MAPETKVDAATAYRAYANILERGARTGDGHELGGLTALTDYDGYGFTLTDGHVSARILFHSKVAIETPNSRSLMRFVQQLEAIAGDAA
ncbi:MAG: DUF3081 family protein [Pseudomonadota bacterium]